MRHPLTRPRAAALATCVAGGTLLLGFTPAPPVAAAELVSFRAVAGADGMRQTITRPDAPLSSQPVDTGVPAAQATIDALGNSEAYGSFLYPSAIALTVPGLLSGVVGQSLPPYPVIATSSDPSKPEDDTSQGPVAMKASSSADKSTGESSFVSPGAGVGQLYAKAEVTVDRVAGKLSAVSRSEATAVDVAGVLRIASVRSNASAKVADGKVTATSSTEVGEMSVAGVRVVLTEGGLVLPGQTVPLPDTSPVTGPLRDAGVTVELVKPEQVKGGVRAGGVKVVVDQATPEGGRISNAYVFGRALALVAATSDELTVTPPPPTDPPTPAPTPGEVAQPPGDLGSGPVTPPSVIGSIPPPPVTASPLPAPRTGNGGFNAVPAGSGTVPFARLDTLSFYLVLVLAGTVAVASQQALRRFGVSSTWTS